MLQGEELSKAYKEFIIDYSAEKGLAKKTIKNKRDALDGFLPFLNSRPLTVESCREYVVYKTEHGWANPSSKANIVKKLRAFISFLYDREYVTQNFGKKIVMPKLIRKPLNLISEELAEQVIFAGTEPEKFIFGKNGDNSRNRKIKAETRCCLRFILRTGLRINEALTLKGSDLSPHDTIPSFLVISKGGNPAQMPLPEDMVEEMKKRMNKERVFETTDDTCNISLKRGMKKLGIVSDLTCHKLRDIYSLSRLRRGNSLQLVSRTLRHTNVGITDKYYSNYVLTDIFSVVNDSPLIKKNLPVIEIVTKAIKAFEDVISKDERIGVEINQDSLGNATIIVKNKWD